ncbi:MAG TPA: BTAD domain-containing putative transcriptional regulator [Conexibacter sp.]|jgi:DNA-binding SARP family transcriptional activator
MTVLRRIGLLAVAVIAVVGAVALWGLRPPLPHLPSSFSSPVSTAFVQRSIVAFAWVALLLLLAIVAVRAARAARRRPRAERAVPLGRRPRRQPARNALRAARMPLLVAPAAERMPRRVGSLSLRLDLGMPADAGRESAVIDGTHDDEGQPPAPRIRVGLLGPFALDGAPLPRRTSTRELIAYLALHPDGATRDQLLEALWPDTDPRRSQPRLWQATSEARKVLGDAFVSDDGRYRLDRDRIAVDLDELAPLLRRAEAAERPADRARLLARADALWRGAPLDGADHEWAEGHQRRLRGERVDLLRRLAETWLEADEAKRALDAAERGIALDELHEPCWRAALDAEARLGQRDAVEARYDALARLLDDRLGLRPEPETTALYRSLLAPATATSGAPRTAAPARRPGAGRASSETRGR